ncbi:hypothetical protein ABXK61_11485 [Burkholderia sola]|nr:hypothetical protein [Burkholderia sp. AcTa6-5]
MLRIRERSYPALYPEGDARVGTVFHHVFNTATIHRRNFELS